MRILIIDKGGFALDWAMRCQDAGHKVKHFIRQSEKTKSIGRGLVDIVDDYRPWKLWADLVFLPDNTLYIDELEAWRKQGIMIVGCNQECAEWELNRGVGQNILARAGVETPTSKVFHDYDVAIRFVKREMKRFVSKPDGDADKALSYCSKSPADMVFMLERWKKTNKLKRSFILQEFIPGYEMAVGGWFGPGGFNDGWCENWEFKKLMNDDLGVATGEQGTVLRVVTKSKLADKVLKPVEEALDKAGYVGYVDVNCIITEDGTPLPLEFTCRPGWPLFNIQQVLSNGDCAQWLMDLAEGRDAKNWEMDTIALGVVLSIPDYPYSHLTRKEVTGIPIYGLKPSLLSRISPCELMMGEAPVELDGSVQNAPCWVTAGDYVLVTSGTGETILQAKRAAYSLMKRLILPNSPMYRTDIGDRLKKQLPLLQELGYAQGMEWAAS